MAVINIHLGDSLEAMKAMKENQYDLAIVDPEFGINISNSPRLVLDKGKKGKDWDSKPVSREFFDYLFKVSVNQFIWGGNYFDLGANKHSAIWDKQQPEDLSFGMFDYAWTSFNGQIKFLGDQ